MGKRFKQLLGSLCLILGLWVSTAHAIPDIVLFEAYFNTPDLNGGLSLRDTQIGLFGVNEFESNGLEVSFQNALTSNNDGIVTWSVMNKTGSTLTDVQFFGLLDADLGGLTSSFDDSADDSDFVPADPLVKPACWGKFGCTVTPDSYEIGIDDFFTVASDLDAGTLGNTIIDAFGFGEGDVVMALGFSIGDLMPDFSIIASFELSSDDKGGLLQFDSFEGLYFNANAQVVPEPSTFALLGTGLAGIGFGFLRRRKKELAASEPA